MIIKQKNFCKQKNFHFLRYLHSDVPEYSDPSSIHRLSRVKQLPQPTNSSDILAMLGDTADPDYPIYRTATGPDGAATLATGKPSLLLVWYKGWDWCCLCIVLFALGCIRMTYRKS